MKWPKKGSSRGEKEIFCYPGEGLEFGDSDLVLSDGCDSKLSCARLGTMYACEPRDCRKPRRIICCASLPHA